MATLAQNNANVLLIGCFFRWTFTSCSTGCRTLVLKTSIPDTADGQPGPGMGLCVKFLPDACAGDKTLYLTLEKIRQV